VTGGVTFGQFDTLLINQYNELVFKRSNLCAKKKDQRVKSLSLIVAFSIVFSNPYLIDAQQIYTWTDENGVTHISDQAPPNKAKIEDIIKYREKTPRELAEIEREKEALREKNERREKIDAAERAEAAAEEADKQAREAMEKAREETEINQEYVRKLSTRRWKRRKFRKRIERIKIETEATQAEAEAAVRQAEAAAKNAREAAEEARKTQ
jgi:hypothetical protein